MPLLVDSDDGYIVSTSSVNGFWASSGTATSHPAYSAAKFAVKGFTSALITDLRLNAPQIKTSLAPPLRLTPKKRETKTGAIGMSKN